MKTTSALGPVIKESGVGPKGGLSEKGGETRPTFVNGHGRNLLRKKGSSKGGMRQHERASSAQVSPTTSPPPPPSNFVPGGTATSAGGGGGDLPTQPGGDWKVPSYSIVYLYYSMVQQKEAAQLSVLQTYTIFFLKVI